MIWIGLDTSLWGLNADPTPPRSAGIYNVRTGGIEGDGTMSEGVSDRRRLRGRE